MSPLVSPATLSRVLPFAGVFRDEPSSRKVQEKGHINRYVLGKTFKSKYYFNNHPS